MCGLAWQPLQPTGNVFFTVVKLIQADADLPQIVLALRAAAGFARAPARPASNSAIKSADDGDHHQQFDQREGGTRTFHGHGQARSGTHRSPEPAQNSSAGSREQSGYRGAISRSLAGNDVGRCCPSQHSGKLALVGLLTSEPQFAGLLAAGFRKFENLRQWQQISDLRYRSVTAAGPSRICTGVPCLSTGKSRSGRPPTHCSGI